jgi:hypothetical protein
LLKRFSTDKQLAAIAGQFVPIKLDVASDEYREWSREHRAEGNSIPKLFVIRADGESLYARSGSLTGDALPEMLIGTLNQAGGILSRSDVETITAVTTRFREQTQAGEITQAIKSLNRLKKMGVPGQLESYASSVIELNQLVNEFAESHHAKLTELGEAYLGDDQDAKFSAMVEFLSLRRQLNGLKQLKPTLTTMLKEMSKGSDARELMRQAKLIDAAAAATSASAKTRTQEKLRELVETTENDSVKSVGAKILLRLDQTENQ